MSKNQREFDRLFKKYDDMLRHELLHPQEHSGAELTSDLNLSQSDYRHLIEAYIARENLSFAIIAAKQGIAKFPDSLSLTIFLCDLFIADSQVDMAKELLDRFTSGSPFNSTVWTDLLYCRIHLYAFEFEKAREYFQKTSGSIIPLRNLAEFSATLGGDCIKLANYDNAIFYLNLSIDYTHQWVEENGTDEGLKKQSYLCLRQLAYCCYKKGDYEKSTFYLNKLLDINPFSDAIWFYCGKVYEKQKLIAKAKDAYEYSFSLNKKNVNTLLSLGSLHLELKENSEALFYFRLYYESDKNNIKAINILAAAYIANGDTKQAEFYYHKALAIEPDNEGAKRGLALLNKRRKGNRGKEDISDKSS